MTPESAQAVQIQFLVELTTPKSQNSEPFFDQTVEECMAVMTEKRVRHLPVIDQGKLIGIVSIGDLVKSIISKQQFVIDQLVQFIHR